MNYIRSRMRQSDLGVEQKLGCDWKWGLNEIQVEQMKVVTRLSSDKVVKDRQTRKYDLLL